MKSMWLNLPNVMISDQASGSTTDWVYSKKNVSLSYTFELRPSADNGDGFIVSADQIIPNSKEVIDGIVAMVAEARALKYF